MNIFAAHKKAKGAILLMLAACLVFSGGYFGIQHYAQAATGVPHIINFQGKVVNSNGTNVTDGVYDFVFKLYDGAGNGASNLYTESWTNAALFSSVMTTAPNTTDDTLVYTSNTHESTLTVGQILTNTTKGESVVITSVDTTTNTLGISRTRQNWANGDTITNQLYVKDGVFQVALGSLTAITGVDFNTDTIYLGVNFTGDGEMKPRIRYTAAPYALNAEKVGGVTITGTAGSSLALSGANALTFTTSGTTGVTLPTTGTLSTLAGTESLTNKTIGSAGALATWDGSAIAVNRGGTGQTTYTDGQLLIGNSSGNTLTKATLSAGAGISVTNGNGTISIANTGIITEADTLATVTGRGATTSTLVALNGGITSTAGYTQSGTTANTFTGTTTFSNATYSALFTGGNVGIGTSTPTANLQVSQGTTGPGTVSTTNGSTTVTGVNTQFQNTFKPGDDITINGVTRTVSVVNSNTSLDTTATWSATNSGLAYTLVGGGRLYVLGNGRVGVGVSPTLGQLEVYGADSSLAAGIYQRATKTISSGSNNTYLGAWLSVSPTNSGATSVTAYGVQGVATADGASSFTTVSGGYFQGSYKGTATVSGLSGLQARGSVDASAGSNTTTELYGLKTGLDGYSSDNTKIATVTNEYDLWAGAMGNYTNTQVGSRYGLYVANTAPGTGGGSVSSLQNQYGLYIASLTSGASSNYALYSAGTTQSYLGGNLGIGDTSPASLLTVGNGDLFQVNSSGAIAASTGIANSGGYTQSGTTANTFTGATSFTASGTALSVTNAASIGGGLTVTGAASIPAITSTAGSLLFSGTTGDTPTSGAGGRLMWIPSKQAFRAGYVTGAHWDAANIGDTSFAFGLNAWSPGLRGIAMGSSAYVTGIDGIALGNSATVTGAQSVALGYNILASGIQAVAIGNGPTAATNYSVLQGASSSGTLFTRGGASYTGTGTVATTSGSATVTGSSTTFSSDYIPGDRITIGANTYTVASVGGPTTLTLTTNAAATVSGSAHTVLPALFKVMDSSAVAQLFVNDLGNVGIGTTTPTANFQVNQGTSGPGTVTTTASGTTVTGVGTQFLNTFKVGDTITVNSETRTISAIASNTSLTTNAWTGANSALAYTLTGGTRLAVFGNGNVGIGTATPGTTLDVNGAATVAGSLSVTGVGTGLVFTADSGGRYIQSYDSKALTLNSLGNNVLLVPNSGNVGIGTATPLTKLDVAGSLRAKATATSVLTGTIDPIASVTVTGVGTLFTTELIVGDRITVSGETRTVTAIASTTSLTVDTAFSDNSNDTTPHRLPAALVVKNSSDVVGLVVQDNDNVGIGTAAAGSPLTVGVGSSRYAHLGDAGGGYPALWLNSSTTTSSTGYALMSDGAAALFLNRPTGGDIQIRENNGGSSSQVQLIVKTGGDLGIGTTAPDRKVEINSSTGANLRLTYNDSDGSAANYADLQTSANGGLALSSAALTANGAIGLQSSYTITNSTGSASQYGEKLVVTSTGSTAATLYGKKVSFVDATSTANTLYGLYVDAATANSADTQYAAAFLNGNVGIGTATPNNMLELNGGALSFYNNGGGYVAAGLDYDATADALRLRANNGGANLNATALSAYRTTRNVAITNNLAIGYSNATSLARLHVSNVNSADGLLMTYDDTNYRNSLYNLFGSGAASQNAIEVKVSDSTTTGQTTVATFRGDGKVGIGTTGPNGKLDVIGTVTGSANYGLQNIGATAALFDGSSSGHFAGSGSGTELAVNAVSGFGGNLVDLQVAGTNEFTITNTGAVKVNLPGTGTTYALCHTTQAGTTTEEIVDCTGTPAADYAEMYPVASDVTYGDLVALGDTTVITKDGDHVTQLVKANASTKSQVIGIVSNNRGDFTSAGYNIEDKDNPMPIALNGRVPVKVSASSPAIAVGDFVTLSSVDGKVIQSNGHGWAVGRALEVWQPNTGKATVMVFVTNVSLDPLPASADLVNNSVTTGALTVSHDATFEGEVTISHNAHIAGRLDLGLSVGTVTPEATLYFAASTAPAGGISFGGDVNLYRSGNATITIDQSLVIGKGLTIKGALTTSPSETQMLDETSTVAANAGKIKVAGHGQAVVLTSTASITSAADGQLLIIQGTDDLNTVTFQDQSTLPGSKLKLGAAQRVLGKGDILTLTYDATDDLWYQVSFSDN